MSCGHGGAHCQRGKTYQASSAEHRNCLYKAINTNRRERRSAVHWWLCYVQQQQRQQQHLIVPCRMNLNGQDWDTVIIRKRQPTNSQLKDEASVNAARRSGVGVETVKKMTAGQNRPGGVTTTSGKAAHKLDAETEDFHHERVNTELKKQITAARTAKKLTQAQLGQLINEKPQIIQDYESGKAIPNPQILSKLSRVLGVTLRKNAAPK